MRTPAFHFKAFDYGIFSFQIDDGPVTDAVDFYDPKLQRPQALTLNPVNVSAGKHQLKIICQGKNRRRRTH
jgi:hypothetical protein